LREKLSVAVFGLSSFRPFYLSFGTRYSIIKLPFCLRTNAWQLLFKVPRNKLIANVEWNRNEVEWSGVLGGVLVTFKEQGEINVKIIHIDNGALIA